MPTANESLRDLLLARQRGLDRRTRDFINRLLPKLERAERRAFLLLRERLAATPASAPLSTREFAGRAALQEMLGILAEAYREIGVDVQAELDALSGSEARRLGQILRQAIPEEITFGLKGLAPSLLYTLSQANPFDEGPLSHYFRKTGPLSLAAKEARRYRPLIDQAFREGLTKGITVETMVRNVRNAGVSTSRQFLRFLIDSATKEVAQSTRQAFLQANAGDDGVVKEFGWVSTIDLRTTPICIIRDGKRYDTNYQPIGHSVPWGAGPGRIHRRCRSTLIAILKSWKELGYDYRELSPGTRASMDGAVPSTTTVLDRLKKASPQELRRSLGKRRADLVLSGEVGVEDLWSKDGRFLKVAELAEAA